MGNLRNSSHRRIRSGGDRGIRKAVQMIDKRALGYALHEARVHAGYDGIRKVARDFAADLEEILGRPISAKSIYRYESGDNMPKIDVVIGWAKVCFPYWLDGIRQLYQASWKEDV